MSALTFTEQDVWRRFEAWLNLHRKTRFSSDDLREYGLHKLLRDPSHQVGAIFAMKVREGEIVEIEREPSRIPSNHKRKISVYEFAT